MVGNRMAIAYKLGSRWSPRGASRGTKKANTSSTWLQDGFPNLRQNQKPFIENIFLIVFSSIRKSDLSNLITFIGAH